MADVCELILEEHAEMRRTFAQLDELAGHDSPAEELERAWAPLADLLDRHADAEERTFYPALLSTGRQGTEETDDAINDHNEIRDAVRRSRTADPGSSDWWDAVNAARTANGDHMAEEERGALADFRAHADPAVRDELGEKWIRFNADHPGTRGVDSRDKEPDAYISEHRQAG